MAVGRDAIGVRVSEMFVRSRTLTLTNVPCKEMRWQKLKNELNMKNSVKWSRFKVPKKLYK
jgi:hypothetical protein